MNNLDNFRDMNALQGWATSNANSAIPIRKNKSEVYQKAIDAFKASGLRNTYSAKQLPNLDKFVLLAWRKPSYFQDTFQNKQVRHSNTRDFYNYKPTTGHVSDYWVDFANQKLGGGAFGYGFVQEEIMFAEMPQLANHGAATLDPSDNFKHSTVRIRSGAPRNADWVKRGSPTPIAFRGINRVQEITGVYGRAFDKVTDVNQHVKPINPQTINVLAIAAPKLKDKTCGAQLDTVEDLFNTAVAGFETAKAACLDKTKSIVIHTGKLGAGCFNNDANVVYVIQKLAAQHVGVDIRFHGYGNSEAAKAEEYYDNVINNFGSQADHSIQKLLEVASQVMR